jgi:hypothetical protein
MVGAVCAPVRTCHVWSVHKPLVVVGGGSATWAVGVLWGAGGGGTMVGGTAGWMGG